MSTYNNLTDGQLNIWAQNFVQVAGQNLAALNLQPNDVVVLDNLRIAFTTGLQNRQNAKDAARAATTAKQVARQNLINKVSFWSNLWQANPNISNTLKQQLGLPIHDTTPSQIPVFVPMNLSVTGCANGINVLRWKRNGNASLTQFVIEISYNDGASWSIVGMTSRTRFEHEGFVPGAKALYRAYALRTGQRSPYSNTAAIYYPTDQGLPEMTEAA